MAVEEVLVIDVVGALGVVFEVVTAAEVLDWLQELTFAVWAILVLQRCPSKDLPKLCEYPLLFSTKQLNLSICLLFTLNYLCSLILWMKLIHLTMLPQRWDSLVGNKVLINYAHTCIRYCLCFCHLLGKYFMLGNHITPPYSPFTPLTPLLLCFSGNIFGKYPLFIYLVLTFSLGPDEGTTVWWMQKFVCELLAITLFQLTRSLPIMDTNKVSNLFKYVEYLLSTYRWIWTLQ